MATAGIKRTSTSAFGLDEPFDLFYTKRTRRDNELDWPMYQNNFNNNNNNNKEQRLPRFKKHNRCSLLLNSILNLMCFIMMVTHLGTLSEWAFRWSLIKVLLRSTPAEATL
mmetsp:Transcript_7774/g.13885  ORF Transcript_7774/g.13885 Transcript_7774/m.13885 type:complete len:111 (-) Transcript_7774:317-649(-)